MSKPQAPGGNMGEHVGAVQNAYRNVVPLQANAEIPGVFIACP